MDLEQKYIEQYKQAHTDSDKFPGVSLGKEIPQIEILVNKHNAKTVLDYGCGKGRQYTDNQANRRFNIDDENIFLYDPGFPEHSTLPDGTFCGVISTDVLEHIPAVAIPKTLTQMFEKAEKFVYLAICTRLAIQLLPNGENAHCTVEHPDWWEEHILKANTKNLHTEVHWYGGPRDYRRYFN